MALSRQAHSWPRNLGPKLSCEALVGEAQEHTTPSRFNRFRIRKPLESFEQTFLLAPVTHCKCVSTIPRTPGASFWQAEPSNVI